jgi:hypothetical protein
MQKHEKKNSKNFVPSNFCESTDYTNLIGTKFNELLILSFPGHLLRRDKKKDYKKPAVLVKCSCGVEFITDFQHVKHNRTLSCGHINRNYYIDPYACSVRSLFTRYKSRAAKDGREFKLDQDQFRKLITSNCTYCGISPDQQHSKCHCKKPIKHNGIDRVDSSLGYTVENSVSCCKICNRAKSDLSVQEFKKYIVRLTSFASTKKLDKIGEPFKLGIPS